ncbi:hypothetical protein CC85DRAFT_286386 [Cutaneotrichosporon oleaginosum]|uniref:GTP cyclohydrolase II n=1 Tax=Cutaneotrichosporon oleaginosum TaxID=879819 RepID=A0A0J0XK59_9TREE|nr:uncharacterized protein CC85DRAFT_286386 [Cutaneotrichosporon oleaginosum]KLT41476.1 hypothetical protein CC85DRAFT_286386 [Cutaneotrichosporon oleaginosum]
MDVVLPHHQPQPQLLARQRPLPSPSSSTASHHITKADLDFLSLISSDSPPGNSSPASTAAAGNGTRKPSSRDHALDALLLQAVIAGSAADLTRHHVAHGAIMNTGAYTSCDQSRPSTPNARPGTNRLPATSAAPTSPVASRQAPRSLRLQAEAVQRAQLAAAAAPAPVSMKNRTRRMSTDPAPIAHLLQQASPAHVNFYHGRNLPQSKPQGRASVRCMARTRVPTPHGDVFLHLYHNSHDGKEHLAIVTDPVQLDPAARRAAPKGRREIRSRSLDACWRDGETDMERVVRGAYVGRLLPGSEGQASVPKSQAEYAAEDAGEYDDECEADCLPLVRIHSECFTGETIGSMRCDCGEQLDEAMRRIAEPQPVGKSDYLPTPEASRAPSPGQANGSCPVVPGRGVVIYMRQEGRGIGLLEKIRAYNLQDLGHDTVTANLMLGHGADERTYSVAAEILRDLGLAGDEALGRGGVRLLTNNPEKVEGLASEGIRIAERVGMVPRDWQCQGHAAEALAAHAPQLDDEESEYGEWRARRAGVGLLGATTTRGPELEKYLRTKIERMGHMIDIPE